MSTRGQEQSIWSGVFERFDDVPISAPVFNAEIWVEKQRQRVLNALSAYQSSAVIPDGANAQDYPLPTMVALLLSQRDRVRIIDFGGAMGQTYFEILSKIPEALDRIDYVVVETQAITENIPDQLSGFQNLSFVDDYKKLSENADIVHIGSTLQYIDNWQELLTDLSDHFNPDFFVLSDLLVGNVPSFVTVQTYYDKAIRVRFINIDEFITFWSSTKYALIYRAYFRPLGNEKYFPNHALPESHRLQKPCHLVFSRKVGT